MHLTIHFTSWVVPAIITLCVWPVALFIAVRDAKGCGDYGVPMLAFGAVVSAMAITVTAWVVFLCLKFFS